ncbi:hypothetical protein L7F22_049141 [Adiantum nelumboides]|nr:hypothetical protein [Adiantum nelumboides]
MQVPWQHALSRPAASAQSSQDQLPKVGAKRPPSTSSRSAGASSHLNQNIQQQPMSSSNVPRTAKQQRSSKRRKSRASPSPPTTHISALDIAHFKALVHHFTGLALNHSSHLLPSTSPSLNSPPLPAAPAPSLAIAESLQSTLHILSSCLQLLHGSSSASSSPSLDTFSVPHAELDVCKGKLALALLQALDHSRPNLSICDTSSMLAAPLSLTLQAPINVESHKAHHIDNAYDHAFFNTSECADGHPPLKEITHDNTISGNAKSMHTVVNSVRNSRFQLDVTGTMSEDESPFQQDCTTSQEGVQESWIHHQSSELERFLLESNMLDDSFS